jgi:cell division transport system permease protein
MMLANGAYFCRSALQGLRRAPLLHLLSVTAIAFALLLGGMSRLATQWLDSFLVASRNQLELTIYLEPTVSEQQAGRIAEQLAELGAPARVISATAALRRLRLELGDLGKVLDDLPRNPLPVTIELDLPAAMRASAQLPRLLALVKEIPGIADVDDGGQAMAQLTGLARSLRFGAAAIFAIASLAAVLIVAATLQLTVYARKEEIEIQKLVGATNAFVRAPFLIEGLIQGVAGALAAAAGLTATARLLGPRLNPLISFVADRAQMGSLRPGALLLELTVAGALLGVLGSLAAVHRFSRS